MCVRACVHENNHALLGMSLPAHTSSSFPVGNIRDRVT